VAKRSVFRDFVAALRRDWRTHLPGVMPVSRPLGTGGGMSVPKASTFYAGVSRSLNMHVFVNFQSSPKAWEVGMFTVNVILSERDDAPVVWFTLPPDDGRTFGEGSYRIGPFVGVNDKWWHLERGTSSAGVASWRAADYSDPERVIAEAVADVTRDIQVVLDRFAVGGAGADAEPKVAPDCGGIT
jgi:hypothetical protein